MITGMYIRLAAALAVVVLLFGAWQYIDGRGYSRAHAECTAATDAIKHQAAATLAAETAKARATEQALQTQTHHQELQDANNQKTVADLSDRLRRLAGPSGRLRDPQAGGCGAGGSGAPGAATPAAAGGATDAAQAGGLFSAAATDFLLQLARDADDVNAAYASCRADADAVRVAMPP